jgi:hypothetical protein
MGVPAPVVVAEMAEWVGLGGGNSGIVGDAAHSFGFHDAANELPASDYSRTRDPNGPYGPYVNFSYACAGDFSHGNDETLRAMHRTVLARLMRGELPMICEFIGQPWADQPVYYWARWNGDAVLQRYTGQGHDHWSHISWYRSRVDQRAHLWTTPGHRPIEEDDMSPEQDNILKATDKRLWQSVILGNETYLDSPGTEAPQNVWIVTAIKALATAVGRIEAALAAGGVGGGPVDLSAKALSDVRAVVDGELDEQSLGGADHD